MVAPTASPVMRPSPGNCSALATAPTAITAPASSARTTAPTNASLREPDGGSPCGGDEEGDGPAPAVECAGAHQADGEGRDADREQPADLARRRGGGSDQAALPDGRAFEQIRDDAGIFATDRETHDA